MISLNESYYDEGFEQGFAKGVALGSEKTKYDIICALIESGLKLEDIAKILKYELSDMNALIEKYKKEG